MALGTIGFGVESGRWSRRSSGEFGIVELLGGFCGHSTSGESGMGGKTSPNSFGSIPIHCCVAILRNHLLGFLRRIRFRSIGGGL
ncbi:hypothetical protein CEXT_570761 [Caerostris extrusa]|uniref:Uncharacterized protein n=1 Tax=Caerostris extrusa TaxID=172846 RepID=A0AAV4Y0U9_CAEEX|nr:hypothetical protein CEXT_570761 [Caerostris extrusa]